MNTDLRNIRARAASLLSSFSLQPVVIDKLEPVSGGCINDCYKVTSAVGWHFLKVNTNPGLATLFECEEKGLKVLNSVIKGITPEVLARTLKEEPKVLLMEWIETGKATTASWHYFAEILAALHRHTHSSFGMDHDNFIGSLTQCNSYQSDWIDFFIINRIEPQLKKAIDDHKLPSDLNRRFHQLFLRCSDFFPKEQPSLLHGDLWSGNFLTGKESTIKLIDPAVYFGHREMDLAMTKLFGGFDIAFYDHYFELFPVEPGIEDRFPVQQLYPLLVHVNLFEGSYAESVMNIIKRIT